MLLTVCKSSLIIIFITTLNIRYYFNSLRLLLIDISFFLADILVIIPNTLFWYKNIYTPSELTYGEVSFYGIQKALNEIPKKCHHSFIDLGCGKGKILFFTRLIFKLNVTGVEINKKLTRLGRFLKTILCIKKTHFIHTDLGSIILPDADIYFMAGTCFSDNTLAHLRNEFEKKNHHFFILSTTYPFMEEIYRINKIIKTPCTWGFDLIYVQEFCPLKGS